MGRGVRRSQRQDRERSFCELIPVDFLRQPTRRHVMLSEFCNGWRMSRGAHDRCAADSNPGLGCTVRFATR